MSIRPSLIVLLLFALALPLAAQDGGGPNRTAEKLVATGQADAAISLLRARIQASPKDAEAYNLLSRAYFGLRRWDEAVAAGEKAVALAPDNSAYHMWLGRAYGGKADAMGKSLGALTLPGKVRREFEKAVALDASNLAARTDLAEFYMEAPGLFGGDKNKARQQADIIAQKDPSTAHWILARMAEANKNFAAAEQEYKAAIAAAAKDDKAKRWIDLASFYRNRGRINDMEETIAKALTLPDNKQPDVLFYAATLLERAGRNFPAAIQALRTYLASNPVEDVPAYEAHYLLGSIYEKQGDKPAAAREYRAALALASQFQLAQTGLRRLGQ
jgi:tetratricopeptide (TPR) repeat protein